MANSKYNYSKNSLFGCMRIVSGPSNDHKFSCECTSCGEYYELSKARLLDKLRYNSEFCIKCKPGTNGYMKKAKPIQKEGISDLGKLFISGKL